MLRAPAREVINVDDEFGLDGFLGALDTLSEFEHSVSVPDLNATYKRVREDSLKRRAAGKCPCREDFILEVLRVISHRRKIPRLVKLAD
jgi:hypothetical protein